MCNNTASIQSQLNNTSIETLSRQGFDPIDRNFWHQDLKPIQKSILGYLNSHAASFLPSIKMIAEAVKVTTRTVTTHLKKLAEKGHILIKSIGKGFKNVYMLLTDITKLSTPPQEKISGDTPEKNTPHRKSIKKENTLSINDDVTIAPSIDDMPKEPPIIIDSVDSFLDQETAPREKIKLLGSNTPQQKVIPLVNQIHGSEGYTFKDANSWYQRLIAANGGSRAIRRIKLMIKEMGLTGTAEFNGKNRKAIRDYVSKKGIK